MSCVAEHEAWGSCEAEQRSTLAILLEDQRAKSLKISHALATPGRDATQAEWVVGPPGLPESAISTGSINLQIYRHGTVTRLPAAPSGAAEPAAGFL